MDIQRKRERSAEWMAIDEPSNKRLRRSASAEGPDPDTWQGREHAFMQRPSAYFGGAGGPPNPHDPPWQRHDKALARPEALPARRADSDVCGVPILCLDWEQVKDDFVWDGTYRNLGIENCSIEHWRRLLMALADAPLRHAFYLDGQEVPQLMHSLEIVFSAPLAHRYLLKVELDSAVLHCHFDDAHTIAFNYDAEEIEDEDEFIILMSFLQLLHEATGEEAYLGDSRERALYLCSEETGNGPLRLL